jgi:type II secretory pathway pseudopilin PulG
MKRKLLIALGLALAIVAVRLLIAAPTWLKERRDNRQFIAVNNLTPERLIARCGQPLEDETKDLYPIVARDIRYKSRSSSTVVLKFSKTAEQSSDWVFMSMQDSAAGTEYETPTAKIAALSCLDSPK